MPPSNLAPYHSNLHPPRREPFPLAGPDVGGFYNLFDTQEITRKPWKRQFRKDNIGYEKAWRPGKAKVDGAGEANLQSGLMCWTHDKWRPCVKHVYDRGCSMYANEVMLGSRKKHIEPPDHNMELMNKCTRRKFIKFEGSAENFKFIQSRKGPGTSKIYPEWEPPFRKGAQDNLIISKHKRKHIPTYKDAFASDGVSATFNPNASLPPIIGKRHLPTYGKQTVSTGVGTILRFPPSMIQ